MRVLLVYPLPARVEKHGMFNMGLASLSAVLKQTGHQTDLLATESVSPTRIESKLRSFAPGLIGVTTTTDQFPLARKLIACISKISSAPVVLGGIHPTVCPDESIAVPEVTAVCVGEGEGAILDIVERLRNGGDLTSIPNLWVKLPDGSMVRNPVRPLIENLDALPILDRDLFDYPRILLHGGDGLEVMASRGCPFPCTFCANHTLRELYRGKGKFVRYCSVKKVTEEIRLQIERFPEARFVTFHDDTFNLNKEYLRELCEIYAENVGLPFRCNLRADLLDEEVVSLLKKANCSSVWIGVEAGSDHIRNRLLKKGLSRDDLLRAFKLVRAAGIKTRAFNMIGSPEETKEDILETIQLNRQLSPDEVLAPTIFRPYPGTALHEYCSQKGWISNRTVQGYGDSSVLDQPSVSARELDYLQELFPYAVKQPRMAMLFRILAHARARRAYQRLPDGVKNALRPALDFLRRAPRPA